MNVVINNSALLLDRWQTVELIDAAGATAALDSGCLWITMDGDQRDIVLGPGESWTVERNGRTLLHAEAPSTVRISEPPAGASGQLTWDGLRQAFEAWVEEKYAHAWVPRY